jgi:hypothetical protein
MPKQILFFRKSRCDIGNPNVTVTASNGQASALFPLNRSNASAWVTDGSNDAENTTYIVDWVDTIPITDILLVGQNFKNFQIQYWDGAAYQSFSTPISATTNAEKNLHFNFPEVETSRLKMTVLGTIVPNDEKYLYQFIATQRIGRLNGWPQINQPTHSQNLKVTAMLSGKKSVATNVGQFSCVLKVKHWKDTADISIVESLYRSPEGFLVWLCGGDEDQFAINAIGYRFQDVYLMRCTDSYVPRFDEGIYVHGLDLDLKLEEVTE